VNYGLYIASSGLTTSMHRMDVAANNLANINTVGFKPQLAMTKQRDSARIEDGLMWPSNAMLDRLGAGVHLQRHRLSFEQGPMMPTGNALDVAIKGDGFLVVLDGAGEGAAQRYTRDGRLARDGRGRLVQSASGMPVLDDSGQPIELPAGVEPTIASDGTISQAGRIVARLRVVDVPPMQRQGLKMLGEGLYEVPANIRASEREATGQLRQYEVEQSAVDPIEAMMHVTDAGRDAERSAGLISNFDRMMERAINGLGRTS
jgi:flagellar basal-body rod protein FlgF